ncbi:MAG TPA: hypothetical protein DCM86_04095 [Verrucomicrobiales bacterium]|nr:hypothetical protein [Verrucomicrobiales bacterium]
MPLATIFTTFQPIEAQLIRSRLEAAGLHPEVFNELSALSTDGYSLSTGGIQVKVPADEAEDARLLMDTTAHDPA